MCSLYNSSALELSVDGLNSDINVSETMHASMQWGIAFFEGPMSKTVKKIPLYKNISTGNVKAGNRIIQNKIAFLHERSLFFEADGYKVGLSV